MPAPRDRIKTLTALAEPVTAPHAGGAWFPNDSGARKSGHATAYRPLPPADMAGIVSLYGLLGWTEEDDKPVQDELVLADFQVRSGQAIQREPPSCPTHPPATMTIPRRTAPGLYDPFTCHPNDPNHAALPVWERYNEQSRTTMRFDFVITATGDLAETATVTAVEVAYTQDSVAQLVERWPGLGLDAVFAYNDEYAALLMHAFQDAGNVPDDVAVVGADDLMLASLQRPPLTSIRLNLPGPGVIAETLQQLIEHGTAEPVDPVDFTLIHRASS
ncbi:MULTISPECIES: substrate-binding domain-containing protein [unclassified Streptomyces]|uniref:substrate-binding domain-containing protein n=1 Tax=unclassified Streptomyces TaxID=2593676 RepID=UPI0031BA170D